MTHSPPAPLCHIAPRIGADTLGVIVIDAGNPDAKGGSLRLSETMARRLPALISEALERFDAQRAPSAKAGG